MTGAASYIHHSPPPVEQTQRNASLYLIAAVVGKASGLVLIPLYLLVLTPEEAGLWAMLGILKALGTAAATLTLDGYLTQEYWRRSGPERPLLAATCLGMVLRWNVMAALAIIPLALWTPARVWVVTCLGAQAMGILTVGLAHYRIEERARDYCLIACSAGGGGALLAAALAVAGFGVDGIALGFALPPLLIVAWQGFTGSAHAPQEPNSFPYMRRVLPGRMLSEVVGQTDRIMVGSLIGPVSLALYDLAARCAGMVGIILSSAKQAVLPSALKALAAGKAATTAQTTWQRALLISIGLLLALIGTAWTLCLYLPSHAWTPALDYLPGALAVPLWTHASLGNAISIYHHRITGLQAWLPLWTLLLILLGTAIGGWISPLGIAWGAAAALATSVLATNRWLRYRGLAVPSQRWELTLPASATGLLIVIAILFAR